MTSIRLLVVALLVAATPLTAQAVRRPVTSAVVDTTDAADDTTRDDEGVRLGAQYGVTAGALQYRDGRSEQAMGALLRWAPVRWFSIATNPSAVHSSTPAVPGTTAAQSHSGIVDLPITATLSHAFKAQWAPVMSGGVGVTLPTGNSAEGFGTGSVGSELNAGLGLNPSDKIWLSLGAGRALGGLAVQSAFSGGSGWGDAGAGVTLTDKLSVNSEYSSDLGAVDATTGRSSSLTGGIAYVVSGATTLNMSASHGLTGIAPRWSMALGIGSAFPSLGHGGGASQLKRSFGSSVKAGLHKLP